jgi:short-subunit dehydrogenase
MRLDGVVCVLTGSTGGIGRPLAHCLAGAGVRLILTARDADRLTGLAAELPPESVVETFAGDLVRCDIQQELARRARRHDARILINLSGGNQFGLLATQTAEAVDDLLTTNLIAPIQLTRLLLPHLQSRGEAMVVNVGSTFGAIGFPGYSLYCASKFGLRGFSEALARELSDSVVRVIYVAPRATRTSMNSFAASAMNAALRNTVDPPEQVADRIVESMRKEQRRTGIGWPERGFARLNQLVPSLVDRAIARQLRTIKSYASSPEREECKP